DTRRHTDRIDMGLRGHSHAEGRITAPRFDLQHAPGTSPNTRDERVPCGDAVFTHPEDEVTGSKAGPIRRAPEFGESDARRLKWNQRPGDLGTVGARSIARGDHQA